MRTLTERNRKYWTARAEGYSKVNKDELEGVQNANWSALLDSEIRNHFGDRRREEIQVLDIGTGPGFFPIILSGLGYQVTAVDLTESMIEKAKENAGTIAHAIDFRIMNAEELEFDDESFDVIVSRNLTWDLPDPEKAYRSWVRVLKRGGLLLNFDANWYSHLYNEEARKAYECDRANVEQMGLEDHYTCTDIDEMEAIAKEMPLSRIMRPEWDRKVLGDIGMSRVNTVNDMGCRVWSETECINYAATPMFMISAVR